MINPNNRYLPITLKVKVNMIIIGEYVFDPAEALPSTGTLTVEDSLLKSNKKTFFIRHLDYYRWLGLQQNIEDSLGNIEEIKKWLDFLRNDFENMPADDKTLARKDFEELAKEYKFNLNEYRFKSFYLNPKPNYDISIIFEDNDDPSGGYNSPEPEKDIYHDFYKDDNDEE